MKEATLEVNGVVVLRFAIANGFRNIQNLVQKLKSNRCPYDYVEVMACPSGEIFVLNHFNLKYSNYMFFFHFINSLQILLIFDYRKTCCYES